MDNNGLRYQIRSVVSCLPEWFRNYAALHMDTLPKLINHMLLFMGFCNVILVLSAWNIPVHQPGNYYIGLNTSLISFLLVCQNVCLWLIFNNARYAHYYDNSNLRFLAPTEFMVGNSLGITIGAALLALMLSSYYRRLARCDAHRSPVCAPLDDNDNYHVRESLSSVAFWSGLVFWVEFCLSLLIAMGRNELANSGHQYEDLSINNNEHHYDDDNFRRYAEQQQQQFTAGGGGGSSSSGIMGTFADALQTSFVGNYSTVPEIRSSPPERNDNHDATTPTPTDPSSSASRPTIKTPLDPA